MRAVALAGICLDAVTTWVVFAAPGYREYNPLLAGLWDGHPLLVAGYFSGLALAVVVATGRHRRLSAAVSAYVVVVMGVFGGGNNLVLFAVGPPSPLAVVADAVGISGSTVVVTIAPACGLLVAAGAVCLRRGSRS